MNGVQCFLCHKGSMMGKQHKHHPGVAGGRWKRRAPKTPKLFKPNLHAAHIMIGNLNKKVRLCTKCLRRVKEDLLVKETPVRSPIQPQTIVSV